MALINSAATTDESTPPDSASSTFWSSIWARIASTCSSMNAWASSGVVMRSMSSGRLLGSMRVSSSFSVMFWGNYKGNAAAA